MINEWYATARTSQSMSTDTFTLLRPEAVERGLIAEICKRFEKRGFTLVAL